MRARELGERMRRELDTLIGHGVVALRRAGPWAALDIDPALASGRRVCELLMEHGVLGKDTHGSIIRLAPPIVIKPEDIDFAVAQVKAVLGELRG